MIEDVTKRRYWAGNKSGNLDCTKETAMDVHEAIKMRWSVRKYSDKSIPAAVMERMRQALGAPLDINALDRESFLGPAV